MFKNDDLAQNRVNTILFWWLVLQKFTGIIIRSEFWFDFFETLQHKEVIQQQTFQLRFPKQLCLHESDRPVKTLHVKLNQFCIHLFKTSAQSAHVMIKHHCFITFVNFKVLCWLEATKHHKSINSHFQLIDLLILARQVIVGR